jgi:acyl-CoA thioester hydrolase
MDLDSAVRDRTSAEPALRFMCEVPLRWSDIDVLRHLNNVVYFRLMEEARVQLFNGPGIERQVGKMMVLAHASCDFLKPMHYPATVRLVLTLARMGNSSIDFSVTLARSDDPDSVCARGRNVMVWADAHSGKAEPWPEAMRAAVIARFV